MRPRDLAGLAGSPRPEALPDHRPRSRACSSGPRADLTKTPRPVCAVLALSLGVGWLGCETHEAAPASGEPDRAVGIEVDVRVVSPVRQEMTRRVELPASVAAFETTTLLSKVSGYLSRIDVDIGDSVHRGQVVARIDVPELRDERRGAEAELETKQADHATAKAELESARAELDLRRITYERIQAVRKDEPDVMSEQTLDEARAEFELAKAAVDIGKSRIKQIEGTIKQVRASIERLGTLIDFSRIQAPFNGVVTQRHVDPGTLLHAETSSRIVTLASIDRVRLRIDVPETEVSFLQIGDPAAVTLDSMPGKTFEGAVTRFAGALDPSTRTMRAEIDLPNPGWSLRPGMYGQATLALDTKTDAITIPADALRVEGDSTFVYCVVEGRAKRFDVKTAVGDGTVTQVTTGLEGHERVVVSARGPLSDGTLVNSDER